MTSKRPSYNALRAFEATVRLSSMTAAAEQLRVTHGAISRHVRGLEDLLGVPLLMRGARSVQPTPEGARLAAELTRAFDMITAGIDQLQPGPLTLACSATIMMNWLIPRIGSFHTRHPQIETRFKMNHDRVDFVRDEISVAIRNSMIEPPREVILREMIDEWIGPVCSPDYVRARPLLGPADLAAATLLVARTRPGSWADWARAAHVGADLGAQRSYEHFYLLIQAAACGLGVAMVPKMLVLDDLRSGKLVAPFGFVRGPYKLTLWIAPHLRLRPDTRALVDWLTRAFHEPDLSGPGLGRPAAAVSFPHR